LNTRYTTQQGFNICCAGMGNWRDDPLPDAGRDSPLPDAGRAVWRDDPWYDQWDGTPSLLELVEYAIDTGDLARMRAITDGEREGYKWYATDEWLETACMSDQLDLVQWLVEAFCVTRDDVINGSNVLTNAYIGCGGQTVEWLAKKFDISERDLTRSKQSAFHDICGDGDLATVKQFAETFNVIAQDIWPGGSCTLGWTCYKGQLHVAQWLVDTFGLTAIRDQGVAALRGACFGCKLAVARWAVAVFDLKPGDVVEDNSNALVGACRFGNLCVIQWLVSTYGLHAADVTTRVDAALREVWGRRCARTKQWLAVTFGHGQQPQPRWSRATHRHWYWGPVVLVLAAAFPSDMLVDVLLRAQMRPAPFVRAHVPRRARRRSDSSTSDQSED
jgi:hypothetical protein